MFKQIERPAHVQVHPWLLHGFQADGMPVQAVCGTPVSAGHMHVKAHELRADARPSNESPEASVWEGGQIATVEI